MAGLSSFAETAAPTDFATASTSPPPATPVASPIVTSSPPPTSRPPFELAPIPPDAPPAIITQAEAIDIVRTYGNWPLDAEPILLEHGIGVIRRGESATVWLVAFALPNPSPYPHGPKCPGTEGPCNWRLDDYAGGYVSDQNGDVLSYFVAAHDVPNPEVTPSPISPF